MQIKQYLLDTFSFNDKANLQMINKIIELPDKQEAIKYISHIANSQYKWMARIMQDPKAGSKWTGAGTRYITVTATGSTGKSASCQVKVVIKDKKIENYQLVVPTTWNASPRDPSGQRSAFEAALIGTPIHNPDQPLEILRTIHSFDPCLACAVHLYDEKGRYVHQINTF